MKHKKHKRIEELTNELRSVGPGEGQPIKVLWVDANTIGIPVCGDLPDGPLIFTFACRSNNEAEVIKSHVQTWLDFRIGELEAFAAAAARLQERGLMKE